MPNPQFRHDELAWFLDAIGGIQTMIQATIAALVIFMFVAVGVYLISQLLAALRRRLSEPRRDRPAAGSSAVDTWRESAARLRDVDND